MPSPTTRPTVTNHTWHPAALRTVKEIHPMSAETHGPDSYPDGGSRKDRHAVTRFRHALEAERQSADLYRGLAAGATGERQQIFLDWRRWRSGTPRTGRTS
jgi:hypothetical protein